MTADIVNLNKARKAKAKAERQRQAEVNRASFGRTKAEKEREALDKARARRELDGARRNSADDDAGRT